MCIFLALLLLSFRRGCSVQLEILALRHQLTLCVRSGGAAELHSAVLVTADHGGHGKVHGTEMDEDMLVPWVLWGAEIRRGHTLKGEVDLRDTCTTLAHLLGLPRSAEWEGKVVTEALLPQG